MQGEAQSHSLSLAGAQHRLKEMPLAAFVSLEINGGEEAAERLRGSIPSSNHSGMRPPPAPPPRGSTVPRRRGILPGTLSLASGARHAAWELGRNPKSRTSTPP